MSKDGLCAIVTGSASGLGAATAAILAKGGARIVVNYSNSKAEAEATADVCRSAGAEVIVVQGDVSRDEDCKKIAAAAAAWGRLDILVNNAGTEEVRASVAIDEALWDRIIDTNLKGAFFCAQVAARHMIAGGTGGSIINLLSLTSSVGIPTAVPYGTSKTGLLGMTRALAAEWAPHGIRVNGIAPGYFRTAMTEAFYQEEAWHDRMLARIPLRRFGQLDDLSGAVVFLAAPASAYVTGIMLPVDGGILASL